MTDASRTASHGRPSDAHKRVAPSLRSLISDRFFHFRNRLLASRAFQRTATAFPLTRPIAQAQARAAFDLCAGFVYSQVLLAVVRLGILDLVAERPIASLDIAASCYLSNDACERLLNAAAAIGVLSRRSHGRYGLGTRGAALRANPGALAMVEHNSLLYADLGDPVALLRRQRETTKLGSYWAYASSDDPLALTRPATQAYTNLMSTSLTLIAEDIIEAYPLGSHKQLLDIGGGDGTLLATVARAHPTLALSLFDLPSVTETARGRLATAAPNVRIHSGSFLRDELPKGADVATLCRILLDHDDASALHILQNARSALGAGGTLLVAEPLSGLRGVERVSDAYFGMYLMAMGSGRPRTYEAHRSLLERAGFDRIKLAPTRNPMMTSLITAHVSA